MCNVYRISRLVNMYQLSAQAVDERMIKLMYIIIIITEVEVVIRKAQNSWQRAHYGTLHSDLTQSLKG